MWLAGHPLVSLFWDGMRVGGRNKGMGKRTEMGVLAIVGAAVTVTVEPVTRQEQPLDTRVAEYWLT